MRAITSIPDLSQLKWKQLNQLSLEYPCVRLVVIQKHVPNVLQVFACIMGSVKDASILVHLVQMLPRVHRALLGIFLVYLV